MYSLHGLHGPYSLQSAVCSLHGLRFNMTAINMQFQLQILLAGPGKTALKGGLLKKQEIDTSVLLENIPLVKFIKIRSGTRVVYFP